MNEIQVMHGVDRVAVKLGSGLVELVLTPDETDALAQHLRDHAKHARGRALIGSEDEEMRR